jgi:hypothetical protein
MVATVLRGRVFIRLPPAVARWRAIQWASGLTYLSTDSIAPVALWEVPTRSIEKSSDFIGNQMLDLSASSITPEPTMLSHIPITPCSVLKINQCFERIYCLDLQDQRIIQARKYVCIRGGP